MFGICLLTPKEKEYFVEMASKLNCDVTLIHGNIEIDGKSIMGVMAMDTTKNCFVKLSTKDHDVKTLFMYTLTEYLV